MGYGKTNLGGGGKKPEGTAVEADVLAGKTFSNDSDIGLTGTMVNRGNVSANAPYTIPQGYHAGGGTVSVPSTYKRTASGTLTVSPSSQVNYKFNISTGWPVGEVTYTMNSNNWYNSYTAIARKNGGLMHGNQFYENVVAYFFNSSYIMRGFNDTTFTSTGVNNLTFYNEQGYNSPVIKWTAYEA